LELDKLFDALRLTMAPCLTALYSFLVEKNLLYPFLKNDLLKKQGIYSY